MVNELNAAKRLILSAAANELGIGSLMHIAGLKWFSFLKLTLNRNNGRNILSRGTHWKIPRFVYPNLYPWQLPKNGA